MTGVLPLALTMGEPAGISGEITLRAWIERKAASIPRFFVIDDPQRLAALAATLQWRVPVQSIAAPEEAGAIFDTALPVLARPLKKPAHLGKPDPANAPAVIGAIEEGYALTASGRAAGLVTNPIQKEVLYAAGFPHPGHTEFLSALAGGTPTIMMLACPGLRVVLVTVHLPLGQAVTALSADKIVRAGRVAAQYLASDFGIPAPRLAVAALNPHAGENGALGREEIEIIAPAVRTLREAGITVTGPRPADTLFHAAARQRYDAVLCMYHDQALIPLKTIDFARGVNVTLGLPIVRTSPDHGTALDIAGTGKADPQSLIAAIKLAGDMAARRRE